MAVKIEMLTRENGACDIALDGRERLWEIYEANIPLFWQHRERISDEPRLFFTRTPFKVHAAYVSFAHSGPYSLGVIIHAWMEHEATYTLPCPKCGDKMVIYSFAGSPLSGMSSRSACCVACGHRVHGDRSGNFGRMFRPIQRIAEAYTDKDSADAMTLNNAVRYLKIL